MKWKFVDAKCCCKLWALFVSVSLSSKRGIVPYVPWRISYDEIVFMTILTISVYPATVKELETLVNQKKKAFHKGTLLFFIWLKY